MSSGSDTAEENYPVDAGALCRLRVDQSYQTNSLSHIYDLFKYPSHPALGREKLVVARSVVLARASL